MKPVDNSSTNGTAPAAGRAASAAPSDAASKGVWSTGNTVFLGEYRHKVDEKGRLALPAKFRLGLKDGAIVTRGTDGCLHLFPLEQWEPLAAKLSALPIYSKPEARQLQREVLGGATPVTPDRQGRILLPANLREYAGLGSAATAGKPAEVVVAGLSGRIEIWPAAKWQAERQAADLDEIGPKLADLGI